MAKAMLTRPHISTLCAYGTHLFRFQALNRIQTRSIARLIVPVGKFGRQQLVKPSIIHVVGRRSVSTGVTSPSNGSGPIDSPLMQSMETKIKEQLNAEIVTVNDAYGISWNIIDVVSSAFEGQSAVNRQRMVYKAIWEELQNVVHAVDQMRTRTPEEAASGK
ncbi:BolA protein [Cynara cardunculus var. scolymus]|uniref:BolA protein n=1 Tax=Cynara cardunculus var. scolymus TaxID=59895 RepID=A0A118K4H9_CYNCS|nr:BolA protein [Cynara cardunculus var. scolymus]